MQSFEKKFWAWFCDLVDISTAREKNALKTGVLHFKQFEEVVGINAKQQGIKGIIMIKKRTTKSVNCGTDDDALTHGLERYLQLEMKRWPVVNGMT